MNKWKVAFFVLIGSIILFITIFIFWAISPSEEIPIPSENAVNPSDSVFLVETTAEDVEKIAMKYLTDELNNPSLPIDIIVDKAIRLNSELTIFGVTVPFSMEFEPTVNEDGNIQLKQTEVNVGKLNIPPITVLKLMNDAVQFPVWIIVRPNEEEIFLDLSRLTLLSGSRVRAKEIDLENNRILLEVIIPNE
ncbi:YpmS family protein [Lysinibacillus telephonicus]|uniref:YpmS family protein n=1 Tax=Lysinibacillus telephonicus TaxID=1714840 RepID=UPI0031FDC303